MYHFNKKMSTVMLQNKQMNNYNDFLYIVRVQTKFYANNITFYITLTPLRNGEDTVT